jgi:hypothetical protein
MNSRKSSTELNDRHGYGLRPANVLLSWDIILAAIISTTIWWFLPSDLDAGFVKDVYGVFISVLSIVFSVYFAALAFIITAGDNDFIHFLEEDGSYMKIIASFRYVLILLLIALVFSLSIYIWTIYSMVMSCHIPTKILFVTDLFLFQYSVFAVSNSMFDAIKYAEFRSRFISVSKKEEKHKGSE